MNIEIPESKLADVSLRPIAEETTRGGPAASPLDGWIQIGEPLVRELTVEALGDTPLAAFVRGSEHRFVLLYGACSFSPAEGEPFEKVWFKVNLTATAGSAIAWSMTPQRLTDHSKLTTSLTLGAELKLEPITVKAERAVERETNVGEVYVEALNLLGSNPVWELRRTRARELRGLHQLQLVVRLPRDASGMADLSLEASVRRKKLGLIPYSAVLEGRAAGVVRLA
jgi:hypothetical protein